MIKITTVEIQPTLNINLPKEKGSYLFIFRIPMDDELQIGRLGNFHIPTGVYHYCGSAHGGGGINSRVMRHLNLAAPKRWHIDYLKPIMQPIAIHYVISPEPLECRWAQTLAAQPTATIPIVRFGASDCNKHCPAHLIRLDEAISSSDLQTR